MSADATLAAPIVGFHPQWPTIDANEAPGVFDAFIAVRHGPPDGSQITDTRDDGGPDDDRMPLARTIVLANLSRLDLSPAFIAAQMQVSRATLYRLFEPAGGVMHVVRRERLEAVRDALDDPMEMRTIRALAEVFAFSSLSALSRSFRNRYGTSPRAWRRKRCEPERARPLR